MAGALVYVMGPSGAARTPCSSAPARCCRRPTHRFAHRYITRPADTGGENHVALSPAEFALRRAHGLFAFHWQPMATTTDRSRDSCLASRRPRVVVSGSREHFRTMDGVDEATVPVLITAPAERLEERLLRRGREDAAAAAERLRRGVARDLDVTGAVTIMNDGALDEAAKAFVRLLATLRHSPDVRRRPEARQHDERPARTGLTEETQRSLTGSGRSVKPAKRWRSSAAIVERSPGRQARGQGEMERHCSST